MRKRDPGSIPDNRTLAKQRRQEQLIKATIRCVAKRGLSATTMADITQEAGLSLGIVNLHFKSKDKLLLETLKYLAEEYRQAWEKTLRTTGPGPAEKLAALVELDFSKAICDHKKISVWFAFWGEARARPVYMKTCAEYDHYYVQEEAQLFAEILRDDDNNRLDPMMLATTLDALVDGLWVDMLSARNAISRNQAKQLVMDYLCSVLPDHFHRTAEPD